MGTLFCCFLLSCGIMNKAALSLALCVFWGCPSSFSGTHKREPNAWVRGQALRPAQGSLLTNHPVGRAPLSPAAYTGSGPSKFFLIPAKVFQYSGTFFNIDNLYFGLLVCVQFSPPSGSVEVTRSGCCSHLLED